MKKPISEDYEILLKKKDDFKERERENSAKFKDNEKKEIPSRNLYGPPYSL